MSVSPPSGVLHTELVEVTDGSIEFEGQRIDRRDPEEIVRLGIVQVMEGHRLFEHLTVEENLLVGAYSRGKGRQSKKIWNWSTITSPRSRNLDRGPAGTFPEASDRCW